jgi:hypothetical protein
LPRQHPEQDVIQEGTFHYVANVSLWEIQDWKGAFLLKLIDQPDEYGPLRAADLVKTDALHTSGRQMPPGFAAR